MPYFENIIVQTIEQPNSYGYEMFSKLKKLCYTLFNPITLVLVQNLSSIMLGNNNKIEVEIKDVELWVMYLSGKTCLVLRPRRTM